MSCYSVAEETMSIWADFMVELRGFEPVISAMRQPLSPNARLPRGASRCSEWHSDVGLRENVPAPALDRGADREPPMTTSKDDEEANVLKKRSFGQPTSGCASG